MTKKQIDVAKKKIEHYEKLSQELSLRQKNEQKSKRRIKKVKKNKERTAKGKRQITYSSYGQYLLSPEWKKIRKRILKRANYKCEICKVMKAYQVHHKHYKNIFNEKDKDLIAVCGTCHQDKHKLLTDEQIEKRVNKLMELEGYRLKK